MAGITVRMATIEDLDVLTRFNCAMATETEDKQLIESTVREGVREGLQHPEWCRYYVAVSGTSTVGQAMVTYEWSDWRNGLFWWFQSVYVHREHRRQGVFRALFDHVKMQANAAPNVCGLRLYVEDRNDKAQATYVGLGMAHAGYQVYELMLE